MSLNLDLSLGMLIGQVGPTELYLPEGAVVGGGVPMWVVVGLGIVVLGVVGVWGRAMSQRRVDSRELAFVALSKRMGLSRKEVAALRVMASSKECCPVGLLMSPSAVRSGLGDLS